MPQSVINIGTGPNSATGDPIRTAFQKCNDNFTSLFTGGIGTGSVVSVAITSSTLTVTGSPITTSGTIDIEAPPASITNPTLANMPATSVKANPTSAPGQPQDFVATGGNLVLQTNTAGTGLQWGPFGTGVQVRGATWSGGTSAIVASSLNDVSIINPTDSLIERVSILTKGGTGSCQVDVWTSPVGAYPPGPGNTIFTVLPTITSGLTYDDTVLSGLSTNHIPAGNVLTFHLVSSSTFTEIVLNLAMVPTQSLTLAGYTDAQAVAAVKAAMTNTGNVVTSGPAGQIVQNTTLTISFAPTSLGQTGYTTLPNGFMMQWGRVTFNNTSPQTVTFPHTFPNNFFNVQLSMTSDSIGQDFIPRVRVQTLPTTSSFIIAFDAFGGTFDAPQYVYWFAVGN
jgi:hypothetical protein